MTLDSQAQDSSNVALIGMAGRFPGAANVEAFWKLLMEGRDSVRFFSEEELIAAGVSPAQVRGPDYVKANQLLENVELFDADVFGIPRREAEILDPQQRLMLETALVALEDAGYDPQTFGGSVGVYVGAGLNTYLLNALHRKYHAASSVEHYQLLLASDKDFLPTRISYKLNLRGPSLCINTACSTALVAVHMACVSLLSGECDMALAGGVSIRVPQIAGYQYQEGMIFSPDGHCRAFDRNATGTILGDGLGIVALKRLADAIRDRDTIHAVIKGSAVNNDGADKAGYTAPSIHGQAAVIADALAISGVEPESIGYIEAHGTATPLGDPIEVSALTLAHRKQTQERQYCALGSVKTNIGHLDTAAGIAGLIKTTLMLKHRTLVPSLHYREPNPQIDFADSPFYVQTRTAPWTAKNGQRLRAGVSAFGIGGTNAHLILEEAPQLERSPQAARPELIVLSANSPLQLDEASANLAQHLRKTPGLSLADVAFTQAAGRRARAFRRIVVGESSREVALTLALGEQDKMVTQRAGESAPDVIFIFPGAHALNAADLQRLCAGEPEFRRHYDDCMAKLPADPGTDSACFARSFAIAQLFLSAGVQPAAVLGFGVGAFVAAAVAGVLSLEDALDIVRRNGANPDWRQLAGARFKAPNIPVRSAVNGAQAESEEVGDARFWLSQSHVQRAPAIADGALPVDLSLTPLAAEGALSLFLQRLGTLWLQGCEIDWNAYFAARKPRRIPLPTYPFRRERYWVDAHEGEAQHAASAAQSALAREMAGADGPARERTLRLHLQRQIAAIIGMPPAELPDLHTSFMELHLESLTLIEIVTRLGGELGIPIPASALVENPTIAAFSSYLVNLLTPAPATLPDSTDESANGAQSRRAAMLEQRKRRKSTRASSFGT